MLKLLFEAQLAEGQLKVKAVEAGRLAIIVKALEGVPEYGARAAELYETVGPQIAAAEAPLAARIAALQEELTRKGIAVLPTGRRADRLAFAIQTNQFECSVTTALEVTSFPCHSLDTSERLAALQALGDGQCDACVQPPEGATAEDREEAAQLVEQWRGTSAALSLRVAACEGQQRSEIEATQLHDECALLAARWAAWEQRCSVLLTPESSRKVADAKDVGALADLAAAQLPEGMALASEAARLRALQRRRDEGGEETAGPPPSAARLPAEQTMADELQFVREMAERLGR